MVPWKALATDDVSRSSAAGGRPPLGLERMRRMDAMEHWLGLSDDGLEDAICGSQALRLFLGIDLGHESVPDTTTVLGFRCLLEERGLAEMILKSVNALPRDRGLMLRKGTVTHTTIIEAPPSTKKNRESPNVPTRLA